MFSQFSLGSIEKRNIFRNKTRVFEKLVCFLIISRMALVDDKLKNAFGCDLRASDPKAGKTLQRELRQQFLDKFPETTTDIAAWESAYKKTDMKAYLHKVQKKYRKSKKYE